MIHTREQDWFWIENSFMDRKDLSPMEKYLYIVLIRHIDLDIDFDFYSELIGCSVSKTREMYKTLLDKELIGYNKSLLWNK